MKDWPTVYNKNLNLDIVDIIMAHPELKGAENIAEKLANYIRPKVYWIDTPLKARNEGSIILGDNLLTVNSFYVSKGLRGYVEGTLVAATLGHALPRYSEACMKQGTLWEGTVSDMLGSFAVEAVVDRFYNLMARTKGNKGLYPSLRFSPGYGDWSLRDQPGILELLDTKPDITVGPGYLLEPVKSITALIGWSTDKKQATYPVGNRGKGHCSGAGSCSNCSTWACMKG